MYTVPTRHGVMCKSNSKDYMILVLLKTYKSIMYALGRSFARCLNEVGVYMWIGVYNQKFLDNKSSSMSFFLSSSLRLSATCPVVCDGNQLGKVGVA